MTTEERQRRWLVLTDCTASVWIEFLSSFTVIIIRSVKINCCLAICINQQFSCVITHKWTYLRTHDPKHCPVCRSHRPGAWAGGSCGPVYFSPRKTSACFSHSPSVSLCCSALKSSTWLHSSPRCSDFTSDRLRHYWLTGETAFGFLAGYYACVEVLYRLPGVTSGQKMDRGPLKGPAEMGLKRLLYVLYVYYMFLIEVLVRPIELKLQLVLTKSNSFIFLSHSSLLVNDKK